MSTRAEDQHAAPVTRPADAFAFGENWQRYVRDYLDPERIEIATRSIADFLEEPLDGKSFVDIGAGSGLFSLGAFRLGAARVISIDVDPDSVAACLELRRRVGEPPSWDVREASILDPRVVAELGTADVVYSWGVLHHTGDMHTAIRNAASVVAPNGLFAIAIYNRVENRFLDSRRWWRIKRRYNHAPALVQRAMRLAMLGYWAVHNLKRRRNPITAAKAYNERGMAAVTDLYDWVGGFPYEYASVDEIVAFCERECGLETLKVVELPANDLGLNRFLFRRKAEPGSG